MGEKNFWPERIQKAKSGVLARHNWSTQTSKLVASWQIAPVKTKRVTVISISILISNPLMLLMLGSPIPNGHYGREILINVINHLEPFSDSSWGLPAWKGSESKERREKEEFFTREGKKTHYRKSSFSNNVARPLFEETGSLQEPTPYVNLHLDIYYLSDL